ncbi:hypothetical protein [Lentzea sp. NPDC003310]|uniref:hypothetical protein n=1 Tax=Lentzea sp. NPDC003310 TaxID=3154447 RepID=UPI0033A65C31
MLSHVEITARVEVTEAAHFGWSNKVEFSHDCFVCRRTGRTVSVRHGAEHGLCHSSQAPLEWQDELEQAGSHPAPIRITGFDVASGAATTTLRCRLSFWWAPFTDVRRPQAQGSELGAGPWVRLFTGSAATRAATPARTSGSTASSPCRPTWSGRSPGLAGSAAPTW